jgi:uncharacterized protein DUF1801
LPSKPKALTALLRRYDPPVRALAFHLRELVLHELAPCHEHIYDAGYTIAVWYSFTGRISNGICLIAIYAKHVNLGFVRGSVLSDPHRLLEGAGAWMRHIKMRSRADIDRPEIPGYIQAAVTEATEDCAPGGERRPRRLITTLSRRRASQSKDKPGLTRRRAGRRADRDQLT